MRNLIYFLLIVCGLASCSDDELPKEELVVEPCLNSEIPCPIIIGEKNEGCIVNIIFIAEGFTEEELPEFRNLSDTAKSAILDMEPFASSAQNLNFYRVESPSKSSGISSIQYTSECNGTTGTNLYKDTPWGVHKNKDGLERFLGMDESKRDSLETLFGYYATGDYAYTIIIANSSEYLGGAEFPGLVEHNLNNTPKVSNMIISKHQGGDIFKYLVRHEFGHSFGDLDDEYVDPTALCSLKEREWFLNSTIKENILTYNPGTWYEGERYVPTGYWREWQNSIMRTGYFETEFSPIQTMIVEKRLETAIGCK
jgi:hypothetical protein